MNKYEPEVLISEMILHNCMQLINAKAGLITR